MKISHYAIMVTASAMCCSAVSASGVKISENSQMFDAAYLKDHLIKGKTTEDDVQALFGKPVDKQQSPSSDTVVWRYSNDAANDTKRSLIHGLTSRLSGLAYSEAGNVTRSKQKSLTVTFTGAGVLKDYYGSIN